MFRSRPQPRFGRRWRLRTSLRGGWRLLFPVSLGLVVLALPIPSGLTTQAWHYFALFVTVIAIVVTEPIPGPAAGLIGITVAGILRLVAPTPGESMQWALTGFH
jgi:L-tartrate/succinate antiporter